MHDDLRGTEDDYIGTILFSELGEPGVANDANHVLMRAARAILRQGRPQAAIALALYRAVAAQPPIRWFGVFIRTAGDRILYFPAVELEVSRGGGGKKLTVDHITLEPDRRTWHFTEPTAPRSRRHQSGGRTRQFGDGRVGWCGITISEEALLPPLMKQTVLRGSVPRRDERRRHDEFVSAARAARHHVIRQPESDERIGSPHFMLTLARTGEQVSRPESVFMPQPDEFAQPFERRELRGPTHISPVELDDEVTIQVAALTLPARAASEVIFCSAAPKTRAV